MRQTLRRSCAACAKSKHSCDLGTPRCSRCIKRRTQCLYANEPLTAPAPSDRSGTLTHYKFGSFDPFDSYPQTRLPRQHVQRLIHSCMCLDVQLTWSNIMKLGLHSTRLIQFSTRSPSNTTLSILAQLPTPFSSHGGHLLSATLPCFTSPCRQHVSTRSGPPRRASTAPNCSWLTLWLFSGARLKTRH